MGITQSRWSRRILSGLPPALATTSCTSVLTAQSQVPGCRRSPVSLRERSMTADGSQWASQLSCAQAGAGERFAR